jgi:hypothetical protein
MINDAFWAAAAYGTGLIEIDREECLQLLAAKSVGRIAYATDAGARILPVNYILVDGSIIFRTVPDGEIYHHALSSICAFEIDEPNEFFGRLERRCIGTPRTGDRRGLRSHAVWETAPATTGQPMGVDAR